MVHDDAIREILETVRATAARIDALQDGAAEAGRVPAEGVAALKTQGEALDKRLRATGTLAEATARQTKENGNYILDKVKRGEMTWPVTI